MNKKRPINLDLSTLKFPAMAIASILHRISGLLLFVLLPLMLYLLDCSLKSASSFERVTTLLQRLDIKILVWAFLAALIFHLLAGIRHMIMDLGVGEEVHTGRRTAVLVMGSSAILIILLGFWLW